MIQREEHQLGVVSIGLTDHHRLSIWRGGYGALPFLIQSAECTKNFALAALKVYRHDVRNAACRVEGDVEQFISRDVPGVKRGDGFGELPQQGLFIGNEIQLNQPCGIELKKI